ncbi:TetR/AcrR family transcriptional regulator [Helicovermis profundi]|uniref:TetR/AcrR family transcriptional regulator n=1 Tax=Helicovermis profundi TaxID=3065157 RepID=A0AAU9EKD6_9FIRM|nr:TetR/AcrR family transcriptional regulator [Clostridia bacterium S502]
MKTKKKKSQITEDKIIESALNLFSEYGYSATPTSMIAKKAGISEGTIFKYFPKKKDLLVSSLTRFIDKYGEKLVISPLENNYQIHKNEKFEDLIKVIIKERIRLFIKQSVPIRVLLTEVQYHEELREIVINKLSKKIIYFGTNMIEDYIKKGELIDKNSLVIFRSIMGAIMLMVIQKFTAPNIGQNNLSMDEEIDLIVDIFLNGIKNSKASDKI